MANRPRLPSSELADPKLNTLKRNAEDNGEIITRVVDRIIEKHCKELDNIIEEVYRLLKESDELDVVDLNYYIAAIPIQLYFIGNGLENVGIQGDSAAAIRKERFDAAYLEVEGRTINDKQSAANQQVVSETVIELAFQRAYKKMKSRLEQADSLLNSLKKVLQWKISELEVTGRLSGDGTNFRFKNRSTSNE